LIEKYNFFVFYLRRYVNFLVLNQALTTKKLNAVGFKGINKEKKPEANPFKPTTNLKWKKPIEQSILP
jgi:hypothetical protein